MKPTMHEHVEQLAKAFDVRLIISDQLRPEEACAIPHMRIVLAAPIHEALGYAVVLHELGHLVAPVGALNVPRTPQAKCAEEEAAWAWARYMALDWTEPMEQLAQWAERTYLDELNTTPRPKPRPSAPAAPKTKRQEIDWTTWRR